MKYFLLLTPTICFANFVSEGGNIIYADKSMCEKVQAVECFALPKDSETKSLKEVQVDDTSKPITKESDPELVRDPDSGLDELRCEAPKELVEDKCIEVTGYEKKLEKQFVTDPVKVADIAAKKLKETAAAQSCEEFKELLKGSAINESSKADDVKEVTRRLLGFWKACGGNR